MLSTTPPSILPPAHFLPLRLCRCILPPSLRLPPLLLSSSPPLLSLSLSPRGSPSIQSQYALSAGLLNSNLKAGSRLATGKLATGVPAPNTLWKKNLTYKTHTHTHTHNKHFTTKGLPGGGGLACNCCGLICLCLQNMWIWVSGLIMQYVEKAKALIGALIYHVWMHTHTHFSEHAPVVFARLCPLRHRVCVCVCEGKWASELDGKGGSAGSNGGQRSGRWERNQNTHTNTHKSSQRLHRE